MNQIATRQQPTQFGEIERVLVNGDLKGLNGDQRAEYCLRLCDSLNLNVLSQPFTYLELDAGKGQTKLILYANKSCTDQLRMLHNISLKIVDRIEKDGVYIVKVQASDSTGRVHEASGAVPIEKEDGDWETNQNGKRFFKGNGKFVKLRGEALANALMKCETKATRRATLGFCGLGVLDESEVDSIPGAVRVEAPAPNPAPKQEQPKALPAPEQQKASTPKQDDAEVIDDDQRAELSALLARKGRSVAQAFAYLKRATDGADLADLSVGEYRRLMEAMPKIPDATPRHVAEHA